MNLRPYLVGFFAMSVWLTAPSNASETDDRIEASARDSYVFKTYLTAEPIKIQSRDGVVTLTGSVSDAAKKSLAEQTVASLPAVKSVDNALEVGAEGPLEDADNLIAMKVNFLLMVHQSVNGDATKVSAHDGVVTLRGEASSLAQKELTTEYARDVEGVTKIENVMTVAADSAEPQKTISEEIDDVSITAQIKTSLMWHRSTSAIHTNVETKNGFVTISGTATNDSEKTLITKIAKDIKGVQEVANNMTVEGPTVLKN